MKRQRPAIAVEPGRVLRELTPEQVSEYLARWLACFGAGGAGVNMRVYMWHVFSAERYPSASGVPAKEQYARHEAGEYVVLSNARDEGFVTDLRPQACALSDWFVFPPNLAWTMAFTHEDGWLGPYFAKSPAYERLNADNQAQLHKAVAKAKAAERALREGW